METGSELVPLLDGKLQTALGSTKDHLRPSQLSVIQTLLAKKNALYVARTGAGKSATYFITIKYLREQSKSCGPAIVVSPLVSLMRDQINAAEKFGLKAYKYDSTTTDTEKGQIYRGFSKNTIDVLFITPETLSSATSPLKTRVPQLSKNYTAEEGDVWNEVCIIVIDEVHCVADWGHDFRPDYFTGLKNLHQEDWFKNALKLCCSATVTSRVERDVESVFGQLALVKDNLMRENISIRIIPAKNSAARIEWTVKSCKNWQDNNLNVLIFTRTKKDLTMIREALLKEKIFATEYHAGLQNRNEIETAFQSGTIKILISTNAIGMGFNKRDIHVVVHFYVPPSPVQWYQEFGRVGRDPKINAKAYLLWDPPYAFDRPFEKAWFKILSFVTLGPKTALNIEEYCNCQNIAEADRKKVVEVATQKGLLQIGNGHYFTAQNLEDQSKELTQRTDAAVKELALMKTLNNPAKCIWNSLLEALGNSQAEESCKDRCSYCKPKETGERVNPSADMQTGYKALTPGNVTVFGLGQRGDESTFDVERIKQMMIGFLEPLAAYPINWTLTVIPNTESDTNEREAKALAKELQIDFVPVVRPVKVAQSMTAAKTNIVREQVLDQKFPLSSWIVPFSVLTSNVLVYDDAMKSGKTIDRVTQGLHNRGIRHVVGLVKTFWEKCEIIDLSK